MKRVLHLAFGSGDPGDLEDLPEGDRVEFLPASPSGGESELPPEDIVRLICEYDVVVTW